MQHDTRKEIILRSTLLILLSALILLPLLMLLAGSFMGADEVWEKIGPVLSNESEEMARPFLIPDYPTLAPYVGLLLDSPSFFVMFWNSVRLVLPVLGGQLLIAVPSAWAFARFRFRGRKTLFTLYIALMLMPFQVTMVSNYLVLDALHLMNTRWAVILPAVFSTFPVFIMYRFFRGIPEAVLEAAALDGAGPFQIFRYIGIPLGAPGVASAMILSFLDTWSMLEQPLTFLKDRSLWPLSLYLPEISSSGAATSVAASMLILIPPLLVFLLGQKHLERGIQAAGLKD